MQDTKQISEKGNQNHNFIVTLCFRDETVALNVPLRVWKMMMGRKLRKFVSVDERVNCKNHPK